MEPYRNVSLIFKDNEKKVYTVMVNNSTNIKKTNNNISPKITKHKKTTSRPSPRENTN
jgi:hypothetical protein